MSRRTHLCINAFWPLNIFFDTQQQANIWTITDWKGDDGVMVHRVLLLLLLHPSSVPYQQKPLHYALAWRSPPLPLSSLLHQISEPTPFLRSRTDTKDEKRKKMSRRATHPCLRFPAAEAGWWHHSDHCLAALVQTPGNSISNSINGACMTSPRRCLIGPRHCQQRKCPGQWQQAGLDGGGGPPPLCADAVMQRCNFQAIGGEFCINVSQNKN